MIGMDACAANPSSVAVLVHAQHEGVDVVADGAGEVGERLAPTQPHFVTGQV